MLNDSLIYLGQANLDDYNWVVLCKMSFAHVISYIVEKSILLVLLANILFMQHKYTRQTN